MNLRRFAAAAAAATLTLTLAPASATAGSDDTPADRGAGTDPKPFLPVETTPKVVQQRDTDTLSLYRQAGLTPSKRVQSLLAEDLTAAEEPALASYVQAAATRDASGNVLPPGLKSHVDTYCGGTGTDGARVQVMYVREADQPDRYAQVAPILRNEMRYMDDAFAVSSMETGGGKRVRWVHDGACNLSVLNVVLPDGSITGTHGKTEAALNAAGYLKANRKYLAFADVPMGGLDGSACGQGTVYRDTKPTDNLNDGRYPQMARVDLECWVTDDRYNAAPLHEFLHTLGAVMPEAPHGTAGFHCTDGADTMCYNDGTATMDPTVCTGMQHDIDCNNDDYFNTNPAPGSYLATNWNTANSPFLETVPRLSDPPTVAVTASTTAPETGDVVTYTANAAAGAEVKWSTNAPWCENTGAAKTGTTFSIQCFDQHQPTVTATASYPTGYTTASASSTVTYTQGPYPTLVVTAPTSAPVGKPFTITANMENPKTTWTYKWSNRSAPGCTLGSGTTGTSLTATCDSTMLNKFGTFSVTATRTADGATVTETAAVKIITAGAPAVTVTGPETVKAGERATFTANVTNATNPTYQWYSANNWGQSTGASVTVQVPQTATDGTDTLYLTVTSSTGERTSVQYTYGVEGAFTMTMNGPDRLTSGNTGTFTVTPNRDASVAWSSNEPNCPITLTADPTQARVTCGADFDGFVTVTAKGSTATETVTRSKTVTVSPTVTEEARDTTVNLTVPNKGYPSKFVVTLKDRANGKAVANATVNLEFRPLNGNYSHVQYVTLNSAGAAYFDMKVARAGYYRVQYLGSSQYEPSVSTERRAYVYTRTGNMKTRTGLKTFLQTGAGKGIANKPLLLQKRVVGTRKWVNVKTYKTNSTGVVSIKTNPSKRTDYRWSFRGDATYMKSSSGVARLS